ncbi:hypothetical protein DMC30DRAFT_12838 [Rhodotorula diobovata]|uniref:Uncharacterized protein n=1 Tax=Rhodotorula diobovata TaxID=5288 RepID=A0A5C5FSR8_9BASI|nr:hypothetical protein DMC30DRAFT_12838 [Rhodotorula diobovata]
MCKVGPRSGQGDKVQLGQPVKPNRAAFLVPVLTASPFLALALALALQRLHEARARHAQDGQARPRAQDHPRRPLGQVERGRLRPQGRLHARRRQAQPRRRAQKARRRPGRHVCVPSLSPSPSYFGEAPSADFLATRPPRSRRRVRSEADTASPRVVKADCGFSEPSKPHSPKSTTASDSGVHDGADGVSAPSARQLMRSASPRGSPNAARS